MKTREQRGKPRHKEGKAQGSDTARDATHTWFCSRARNNQGPCQDSCFSVGYGGGRKLPELQKQPLVQGCS